VLSVLAPWWPSQESDRTETVSVIWPGGTYVQSLRSIAQSQRWIGYKSASCLHGLPPSRICRVRIVTGPRNWFHHIFLRVMGSRMYIFCKLQKIWVPCWSLRGQHRHLMRPAGVGLQLELVYSWSWSAPAPPPPLLPKHVGVPMLAPEFQSDVPIVAKGDFYPLFELKKLTLFV
jgi:hypothetical protein